MDKNKIIIIILLVTLLVIAVKENYYSKLLNKFKSQNTATDNYSDRLEYKHETALYQHYNKKGNVVMLGNSITYRAHWNELLNRTDIINRGIGFDTTEGMLNRLETVINVNPKICFVLGGINDINAGIDSKIIASNIDKISKTLIDNKIKPIISSVIYVSDNFPDYKTINSTISSTNKLIESTCDNNNIAYLDLNASLSANNLLKAEYSFDGIHLTALGYNRWKEIILPIIEQEIKISTSNLPK